MAVAYLLDPTNQYQNRAGVNNVDGWFEVFEMNTDDRATVYTDFAGTLAPAKIKIDNNGRAVMIVESGVPYRVEMREPNGDLVYTQEPIYTVATGGGASVTRIVSTDGSIGVDATTVGSVTTYDLSKVGDGADLLEWIRCDGGVKLPETNTYRPTFTDGSMEVGTAGLILGADRYYHVTAHVRATKNVQREPWYDNIAVAYKTNDGNEVKTVTTTNIVVDYSLGLSQDYEISTDVFAEAECELLIDISGQSVQGGEIQLVDVEAHRVYSGAPYIPSGVLSRAQAADIYQPILTAGDNITIEDNVISASTSGEKNIHRLLRYYTNAADADENHPVGDWLHDLDAEDPTDPSGHPMVTADQMFEWYEAGQVFDLYEGGAGGDIIDWSAVYRMVTWQDQSEWWSQYAPEPGQACRIEFYRAGMYSVPNRVGLIAYIRYKDEDYMRLYEIKSGQSIWMMELQEALPYYGRDTHNGEFLRVKADGSGLEWVAMDLSDYITETDLQSALSSKQDVLTAGSNISIQNNVISATDTTYTAGPGVNINNDIISVDTSVVATQSDLTSGLADKQDTLTAGQNITINNNVISATAAQQVNADWTATSGVAEILHKPDLSIYAESANLATVATTGDYDDLTDKPDLSVYAETANLATVATTGDYDDLTNKPDLSVYAESANLATVATTGDYDDLIDKPDLSVYAETANLATVATTGDYDDLVNKPTIPAAQVNSDWNANSGVAQILNKPNLALKEDVANKAQTLDPQSTTDYPSSAATANFVNSSVATATANFLGNYTLTDLSLTYPATTSQIETALDGYTFSQTPTNNDYVYVEVQNPQTTGIDDEVQRYKFNGTSWLYEYTLNNSSFTAAEKAAIDSGIDSAKVAVYDAHVANGDIHVTLADKTAWNAKQNALTAGSNIQINNDVISATDTTYGAGTGLTLTGTTFAADTTVLATQQDLSGKQNALTAGSNITISGDTISATDTTYSAGTGIDITGTTISADTSVLATQTDLANKQDTLTAGSNIQINSNVISATDTTYSAGTGLSLNGTTFSNADPLPAHTSSDEGKILKVDSNGDLEWGAESGGTVTDVQVNGTSVVSGGVADITVPAAQVNSDWTASSGVAEILHKPTEKTLTAGANISITEANDLVTISAAGGAQQQSDWTEADTTAVTYIANKPVPKTLVAGTGITITENSSELVVASTNQLYNAGTGLTLNNATFAIDTSVVATQSDLTNGLASKQGTLTAGANINIDANNEISATDTTYTAGDGIQISNQNVISSGYNETLLWSSSTAASSFTLSERISNFERLKLLMQYNGMKMWCDGTVVSAAQFTVACCGYANNSGDGNRLQIFGGSFTSSNGTTFASEAGKCIYFANGSAAIGGGTTSACTFLKIYGVNRIASN